MATGISLLKKLASLIPNASADHVTFFINDSGVPSFKDESGTVTTILAAGAITSSGLTVSTTDRILGRDTAGSGAIEELTLSQVLDFVGSAARGDILYRNATTWVRLAAGTSGHFLKTNGAGADPAWAAAALTDGDKGDITVSGSGATFTIDDGAVTYAKMQDISATQRVLGRNTAGAGDAEEVTLTQLLDWIGSAAQGDILYRGASSWARLAAGTGGQVLTTGGPGANPFWTTNAAASSGRQSVWVPARAMTPQLSNPPSAGSIEMATNDVMVDTLDFDPTTDEFAQFSIRMPKSWNEGTVAAVFVWSHAATTTNFAVVWGLQAVAISNDDALDAAFGTAQTVTDTGGTTNDLYESAETAAVTVAGTPAEGDMVIFRVYRDANAGGDNLAVDARLHGVMLFYTADAANDS